MKTKPIQIQFPQVIHRVNKKSLEEREECQSMARAHIFIHEKRSQKKRVGTSPQDYRIRSTSDAQLLDHSMKLPSSTFESWPAPVRENPPWSRPPSGPVRESGVHEACRSLQQSGGSPSDPGAKSQRPPPACRHNGTVQDPSAK